MALATSSRRLDRIRFSPQTTPIIVISGRLLPNKGGCGFRVPEILLKSCKIQEAVLQKQKYRLASMSMGWTAVDVEVCVCVRFLGAFYLVGFTVVVTLELFV